MRQADRLCVALLYTNQVTQWKETNSAGLSHLIFIWFSLGTLCGCRMERARPKTRPLERSPTRCQNGTPSSALSVQAKGSAMLDRTWSNWGSNFPKNTPTKRMPDAKWKGPQIWLWCPMADESPRRQKGNWSSIGQSRFRFCPSASLQILEICTATILLCRLAAIKCKRPSACLHWPTGVPGHMFGNVWNMVGTFQSWWHST